jgi:hypothetical protein
LRGNNPESREAQAHQSSNNDDDEAHQTLRHKGYGFEGSEGAIGQRVNVSHAPLMERW